MLRLLLPGDPDRLSVLERLYRREPLVPRSDASESREAEVLESARWIIAAVRVRGDAAVRELTMRFEGRTLGALEIDSSAWHRLAEETAPDVRSALERAHHRIRRFHEEEARRLAGCGFVLEDGGTRLGLRLRPLGRVGLYVPGGTARYPSSVLMAAVPARVAGVGEVILVTPGPSAETLCAASIAGVDRVFAIGGAQAVAALAYGTESVPRVDKIVGPGNAYVAAAKRLVYGDVAIDQVAGPSEILILADARANADWIAADLLSQAEHDGDASAVLVTPSAELAANVARAVLRRLEGLPRREIATASLRDHGVAVVVGSLDEAVDLAVRFAPEHLELLVEGADAIAERVPSAGAIFLGAFTPEAAGDYYAGPNHVLPTGGAARFGAPLGVHDFLKRTSLLAYTEDALRRHAPDIIRLAEVEGLHAHGRAVAARLGRSSGEEP